MTEKTVGDELASRRTGMAFQRTRMAADRTLMGVIRTSLWLIGFGFTISQFFRATVPSGSTHNFGISLVLLGIAMLILGMLYHVRFMAALRKERRNMKADGLIYAETPFPPSLTLITAIVLLI